MARRRSHPRRRTLLLETFEDRILCSTTGFSGVAPSRAAVACGAFTLVETLLAVAIAAVGFLGLLASVTHAGKLASAAEEDTLAAAGLDQRIDQLRMLDWAQLTGASGVTADVWTERPAAMAGIPVAQETITISGYDVPTAKTLEAIWAGVSAPTAEMTGGGADLSTASAVKVVATVTWTGRRSSRVQTRSAVTVISRGGISNSELP